MGRVGEIDSRGKEREKFDCLTSKRGGEPLGERLYVDRKAAKSST